ncbi:MAG: NifU family protein [Alphaproteobacteria bacterium]|nr:NifU family protein [Alphaproteobacteria bacterium]
MFIQTENTPNPATIKFLPGKTVMETGTADFQSAEKAGNSPLAQRLFMLPGVASVFLGRDFISVSKKEETEWAALKSRVLSAIMDHYFSGEPAIIKTTETTNAEPRDEVTQRIIDLIDERIRPAVAQDGGDIVFEAFEDGIVYLEMRGACAGCPSSTMTLKAGIENMLKHYVPEVKEVRPVVL